MKASLLFPLLIASTESLSTIIASQKPYRIFPWSKVACGRIASVVHQRLPRNQHTVMSLSSVAGSSQSNDAQTDSIDDTSGNIRLLALHGSEGSGEEFTKKLLPLQQAWPSLQIQSFDAPFANGRGFSWWKLGPGERSFSAETYPGFDTSLNLVTQQMNQVQPQLVLAHSQGAIFTAALLALQHTTAAAEVTDTTTDTQPQWTLPSQPKHPPLGYILNGLAWPNPFAPQFFQLLQANSANAADATTTTTSTASTNASSKPRILVIIGQADTINPPSSAERVVEHFQQAGFPITILYHDGGHAVPFRNDACVAAVSDWIQQGLASVSP